MLATGWLTNVVIGLAALGALAVAARLLVTSALVVGAGVALIGGVFARMAGGGRRMLQKAAGLHSTRLDS